jgi:hypothetical protein
MAAFPDGAMDRPLLRVVRIRQGWWGKGFPLLRPTAALGSACTRFYGARDFRSPEA